MGISRKIYELIQYVILTIMGSMLFSKRPPSKVPSPLKPLDPILGLPAVVLAKMIRERKYTSRQVVEAYLNRIAEVNGFINCAVAIRSHQALKEADEADQKIQSGNYDSNATPFLGVPCSIKEAFALTGMPNTSGLKSRVKRGAAAFDAAAVERLRNAGFIPLCVTNTSELCMWYESSNTVYGTSNNPYDLNRIVGGSSGGEAGLIAASGAPVGLGSDIGGSIRMPAFFNGIWGLKPSSGVIPNEGQHPVTHKQGRFYLTTGPICRFVEDIWPMYEVLADPFFDSDPIPMEYDQFQWKEELEAESEPSTKPASRQASRSGSRRASVGTEEWENIEGDQDIDTIQSLPSTSPSSPKIGPEELDVQPEEHALEQPLKTPKKTRLTFSDPLSVDLSEVQIFSFFDIESFAVQRVSKELREIQIKAEEYLIQKCGAKKKNLAKGQLKSMRYATDIWSSSLSISGEAKYVLLCGDGNQEINAVWELVKYFFGGSDHTFPSILLALVEELPAKIAPKTVERFAKEGLKLKEELENLLGKNGVLLFPSHPNVAPYHKAPLFTPFNFAYTAIFNILETPVMQCPLGLNDQGLPLGIQVVAAHGNEHLAVAVAHKLAKGFGGWIPPPI